MKYIFLLLLFSFKISAVEKTMDAEAIQYHLNWWVAPDGQVTKIYELNYQGSRTLKKLNDISEGKIEKYLHGILPQKESTDEFVKSYQKKDRTYVFIFRGQKQFIDANSKLALPLLIPVYDDPVSIYIEAIRNSKYDYRYQNISIINKVTYRTPWEFQYFSKAENTITAQGLEVTVDSKRIENKDLEYSEHPGADQKGAETVQTIKVQDIDLKRVTIEETELKQKTWAAERGSAAVLFNIPTSSANHPKITPYQWGGAICILLCGRNVVINGTAAQTGFDFILEINKKRQFSKHFSWKIFTTSFNASSGEYQNGRWYVHRFNLGTAFEFSYPWVGTENRKHLSYLSLIITPGISSIQFSHGNNGNWGNASYLETKIRWAASSPSSVFVDGGFFDIFLTQFYGVQNLNTDIGFGIGGFW